MQKNNTSWCTPNGSEINFNEILLHIKSHTKSGGSIFIGTDSFLTGAHCVFANAICLHGAASQMGGMYYIKKSKFNGKHFKVLVNRMLSEIQSSIETALKISDLYPDAKIELHLDISGTNGIGATSQYADMLTGYAKSTGFPCKIKPHSWASSSVADKHSK
jgi:predicted RNase H-related nuclease YkuK (DUF458 family)